MCDERSDFCPSPHAAASINERTATASPLIVISLSQGELSRDRARTEQFSFRQSRRPLSFCTAAECEENNKAGEDGGTDTESDRHEQSDNGKRDE